MYDWLCINYTPSGGVPLLPLYGQCYLLFLLKTEIGQDLLLRRKPNWVIIEPGL